MFLHSRLYHLGKVKQLAQPSVVHKVGQSLRPAGFELAQNIHQLVVVLQLRVNNLDILIVFPQQRSEFLKYFFDAIGQVSDRVRLCGRYSSIKTFSRK